MSPDGSVGDPIPCPLTKINSLPTLLEQTSSGGALEYTKKVQQHSGTNYMRITT